MFYRMDGNFIYPLYYWNKRRCNSFFFLRLPIFRLCMPWVLLPCRVTLLRSFTHTLFKFIYFIPFSFVFGFKSKFYYTDILCAEKAGDEERFRINIVVILAVGIPCLHTFGDFSSFFYWIYPTDPNYFIFWLMPLYQNNFFRGGSEVEFDKE